MQTREQINCKGYWIDDTWERVFENCNKAEQADSQDSRKDHFVRGHLQRAT